jgi:hypothetical protein
MGLRGLYGNLLGGLDKLNAEPSPLVHRGGIADQKFLSRVEGVSEFPGLQTDSVGPVCLRPSNENRHDWSRCAQPLLLDWLRHRFASPPEAYSEISKGSMAACKHCNPK